MYIHQAYHHLSLCNKELLYKTDKSYYFILQREKEQHKSSLNSRNCSLYQDITIIDNFSIPSFDYFSPPKFAREITSYNYM